MVLTKGIDMIPQFRWAAFVLVLALFQGGCSALFHSSRSRTAVPEHMAVVYKEVAVRKAKEHLQDIKLGQLYNLRKVVKVQLIEGYKVRGGETFARRPDDSYSYDAVTVWEVVFAPKRLQTTERIYYVYVLINAASGQVEGQGNWF